MANKIVPINEALGRFYPGGPLPKRPSRPMKSRKPIVFKDFDAYYDEFFSMLDKDINIGKMLGNFVLGELKADFNQAMKASVSSPSSAEAADIPEEFAEDIHEMPGAVGVSVNLNPVDWIKQPQKESLKIFKDIIKGTFDYDVEKGKFDFSDVDAKLERDFIWTPLVEGNPIGKSHLTAERDFIQNPIAKALQNRLTSLVPDADRSGTGLQGTYTDFKKNTDSYIVGSGFVSQPSNPIYSAQSAFVDGMTSFHVEGSREDKFTNIGSAFLKVLDAESRKHTQRHIQYNVLDPEVEDLLRSRIDVPVSKHTTTKHESLVLDPFGNDFLSITSKTLKDYIDERDGIISDLPDLEAAVTNAVGDKKALKKANKALKDAKSNLVSLDGKIHSAATQLVSKDPDDFGALNEVIKKIDSVPSIDSVPELANLSKTLKVLADPEIGVTRDITSLRHVLFEMDQEDKKSSDLLKKVNEGLTKTGIGSALSLDVKRLASDPAALASFKTNLLSNITALQSNTSRNKSEQDLLNNLKELELSITDYVGYSSQSNTLVTNLKNAVSPLENAAIGFQSTGLNDTTLQTIIGEIKANGGTHLTDLSKVSSLEATIATKVAETLDESRSFLKDKAYDGLKTSLSVGATGPVNSTILFRDQYELLNGMNDFYGSFRKVKGDLDDSKNFKKGSKEFDVIREDLIKSCDDQVASYNEIRGRILALNDPKALKEFESIFSAHLKASEKLRGEVDKVSSIDNLTLLLRKYESVYDTKTIGGGIGDSATRRFMESVYFSDGIIAKSFQGDMASDEYEHSKRLYLIARFRYEKEKAQEVYNLIKGGPASYGNLLFQRYVKEGPLKRVAKTYQLLSRPKDFVKKVILEPTHYFGLVYDEKKAKAFAEDGGLQGWIEKSLGQPLTTLWGRNKLKISGFEGMTIWGGKHFEGAIVVADIFRGLQSDGQNVSLDTLSYLFNVKRLKDLEENPALLNILKGIELKGEGIKDVNDVFSKIQNLKKWFLEDETGRKLGERLGIIVGNDIVLSPKAYKFFNYIAGLFYNTESKDPTKLMVGRLRIISEFLSKVQGKYIALIASIRKPIVYFKTLLTDALTQVAVKYLDSVTGGLGELLRGAVRFVVNVAVDWGGKLISSIMKFDLTEFIDEVTAVTTGLMKYLMYFVLAPLIIIIMLFNSTSTLLLGITPVDNSRTNGVLLEDCGPIDERAQGVGSCGICDASVSIDWSPYTNGKATFTEGIAFVLNAAANDFDIPAPALGAIFYVEGWSENVDGKFDDMWTKDNVCSWSLNEGPLLPGCEDRTSSSDARGSFQWIPGWFHPQIEASGVDGLTPIPRAEYDPCNFLDAAYASAGRFKELATAAGIGGCGSDWLAPIGTKPSGYADGLPSTAPKIQWAILHYACGAGGGECFQDHFLEYSEKGLAVFNSLKCF